MPRGKRKLLSYNETTQLLHDVHNYGINIHTREIFLMGHQSDNSDEDPGVDYRAAGTFLKNLSILEGRGRSKVTIHMQIDGGAWADGMAIFDAIRAAKSQVTAIAYAQASSMSGIILQAADHRIMMLHTHFMLHYGSVWVDAPSKTATETVKFNELEGQKMLHLFAERAIEGQFFKSRRWGLKRVAEYLDKEMRERGDWYLTAEQAVEMGFADEVLTPRV